MDLWKRRRKNLKFANTWAAKLANTVRIDTMPSLLDPAKINMFHCRVHDKYPGSVVPDGQEVRMRVSRLREKVMIDQGRDLQEKS